MKEKVQEVYSSHRSLPVNELIDVISDLPNIEFVGRGSQRAVFRFESVVYKIPISSTGNYHNRLAKQNFETLESKIGSSCKDVVAPINELYHNILVQQYCPVTTSLNDHAKVKKKLDRHEIAYTEWNENDVGQLNSTPVLLDLANLKL